MADRLADVSRATVQRPVSMFLTTRLNVVRHVLDAMADSQDKQKEKDDDKDGSCNESYEAGDQVFKTLSVCCVKDEAASSLHRTIYLREQEL